MAYNQQQNAYGAFGQGGYPNAPPYGGYPQGGYPQGGYPQGGFPQQGGYPQPQPGFPQGGGGYPGGQGPYPIPPTAGFRIPIDPDMNKPGERFEGFEFSDKKIRMAFIRKVYSILMVQLLITFGFVALFVYHEPLKLWTRANPGAFYGALAVTFVTMIAMACCEGVRKKFPGNFICLAVFTLAEGFVLGTAASTFKADAVLLAVGITAVICLSLTAFSFQTKWDFTGMGAGLFVVTIVFMIFGFLAIFLRGVFPILNLVYACIGALLFSVYLVYDTQLMIGGKHKCSISPEEYIFAALNIYMDIVNIFIYILSIIGASSND